MEMRDLFHETADYAADFLESLDDRPVLPRISVAELRQSLGGALPEGPSDPRRVVSELAAAADPGVIAIPSGRFFGFVIGGGLPAAVAADWLTAVWDQNAGLYVAGPSAAVVEEIAGRWLTELFGLPADSSFGFVTGCQMAHVTALAAARHAVLERTGWDVNRDGLQGAPRIRVVAGDERHVTVDRALRFLGLGTGAVVAVPADEQGRMRVDGLRSALAEGDGPTIVCAQAGNVNTGAFDPLPEIADAAAEAGAWLHVDGAFGLWAGATPRFRHLVEGVERADSWAADAHKWLNVPYDSGIAFCAHPDAHRKAMSVHAAYLVQDTEGKRDALDWTPEFSRRARGFPVYAALRSLGRSGVAELVEGSCDAALLFAERLGATPGVEILNDVVLNQVLVRFGDDDEITRRVVRGIQEDGTAFMSGTVWHGVEAMRISVSNWQTDEQAVDASVEAILRVAEPLLGVGATR